MHICHLTSAHPRFDIRIFHKECRSLAKAGYQTSLIVADGRGDEIRDDIAIHDVGEPSGRLDRIRNATRRVFSRAVEINASIYHLHDPELIPIGLKLKRLGKQVIFDAHEDVPKQLLSKPYLNRPARWSLSHAFFIYEKWACAQFDAIIAATPFIRDKFIAINPATIGVNNFPMLGELEPDTNPGGVRSDVCYIGGIAAIRGAREIVRAMEMVKSEARLKLVGAFSEHRLAQEVRRYKGWERTDELGFLDRTGVRDVMARSFAGLVTFLPAPNHIDAQPNKMFEYMSAGVPVIASRFSLWREIVEGNQCGVCVDPLSPGSIAEAIDYLADRSQEARRLGENGRQAVQAKYNWDIEERKLLDLYRNL